MPLVYAIDTCFDMNRLILMQDAEVRNPCSILRDRREVE
jgi:hypothetical protein